jgi:DnaJ-class molecular chaperone
MIESWRQKIDLNYRTQRECSHCLGIGAPERNSIKCKDGTSRVITREEHQPYLYLSIIVVVLPIGC